MSMGIAIRPSIRAGVALAGSVLATAAIGAAPALADAGKVLVFTGTGGTANPVSTDAAAAIQALGSANNFTVDTTADATKINAANLAGYRAVVFVNSAGDALPDPAERADLQTYVQNGGGFVGVGETATLEQGNGAFFDTLIGLTGNPRVTATGTVSASRDVEFLDRVHPSTRDLPMLDKGLTETWYTWATNPTGTVQTVARVRGNILPDGTSVTNDAVQKNYGNSTQNNNVNGIQPSLAAPASWCRDIQSGRSFYTELGSSSADWQDANINKHALGAIEWAAGMVRGNCKATINSDYTATRVTPMNPSTTSNQFNGEMTRMVAADDGRIFYGGRAICTQGQAQVTNWDQPNVGQGCGTIHVFDPTVAGSNDQNPDKISMVTSLQVYGAKGGGAEAGQTSTVEVGLLAMQLDPKFTKGRPYIYAQYFPYYGGEMGYPPGTDNQYVHNNPTVYGRGFDRSTYMGERRLSRFTYDPATKTIVPGSEKVIMHWEQSVYSCCHAGASAAWDSQGNLYISNGDNIGNSPNSTNGGYTNADPSYTIPCPGAAVNTHCGQTPADQRPDLSGQDNRLISYADARGSAANTNAYESKIIRIHPLDNPGDTPGIGTTYTIPDASAPNGPQLFPPDSQGVKDGLAKPEIFAMGVRNDYTIHIDPKTDLITTAWVGPDQATDSTTWGEGKTENATIISHAANYGWPFCQAGNRWDYRAKLPSPTGGGLPGNLSDNIPGTVGGGTDGQTGAFWDCRGTITNTSPYNTGLTTLPAASPVNLWYGPQGGCYSYPKNANGVGIYTNNNYTPSPAITRLCPFAASTGGQAPMDGGIYRRPANAGPNAWPSYWDGRWFLMDFASPTALRHALLMDPATMKDGGQPVSADSLLGIIPSALLGGTRPVAVQFGADGALYVASYGGCYYCFRNNNMGVWRFDYVGGDDTPGPDPQATPAATSSKVDFGIGKSGGVSYTWKFDDGATATGATASHSYLTGGTHSATLTVTYADGQTASKDVSVTVPPTASDDVGGTVIPTLALTLGPAAGFGNFTAAVANTYNASTTANVVSTGGDATLTVADTSATAPGHLVNGTFSLPQAVKARATNSANSNTTFANVSSTPLTLLTYGGPTSNDAVALQFQQAIAATDALRSGSYSKTLTFTLSTTTP